MSRAAVIFLILFLSACNVASAVKDAQVYSPPIGSIVLRVEVISVEATDWTPNCIDQNDLCIPVYFWYRYRARVKKVMAGSWSNSEISFAHLQHAEYIPEVTKDCYVVLTPAEELGSKIEVPFVADKILSRFWKPDRAIIKTLQ